MKIYYEVYENAKTYNKKGKLIALNKKILTTKSRKKALDLYAESENNRWVEEITDDGFNAEQTDIITA